MRHTHLIGTRGTDEIVVKDTLHFRNNYNLITRSGGLKLQARLRPAPSVNYELAKRKRTPPPARKGRHLRHARAHTRE